MSTATIFGSFPDTAAQRATAPAHADSAASTSIFGSYTNHLAVAPAANPARVSALGAWLARMQQAFDRWSESNAQSRADARLWDMARSDHRVMGELMHAGKRDDGEALAGPVLAWALPALPVLEAASSAQLPRVRTAGQGWGRVIADAYQNRFHESHQQHA